MEQFTPRPLVKKSALQTVAVKDVIDDDAVDRYWELLRLPGNRRARAIAAITDRTLAASALVSEIDAPTLIIWGAEDQLIYASAAQTFDERMPNADVVIYKGVGHLPMEEAPQRTALDLDAFLERTVKSDRARAM
ncbi:MAG: alpha/beta hydrolase [Marinicaulis sp.]|nr:alpha/beta hydrolase [Marinicaulis sp.]